jgi:hypothetical protein
MRYEGKGKGSGNLGKIPECLKNIGKTSAVGVEVHGDLHQKVNLKKNIFF